VVHRFAKYVGSGNDFIIFDQGITPFPCSDRPLIRRLCSRHWGIGADGLLLVEPSPSADADARMRIFNADGSEAEMCGNGLRCCTHWLYTKNPDQTSFVVDVSGHLYKTTIHSAGVSVEMSAPTQLEWDIQLPFKGETLRLHALNTGVPHAVIAVDAIDTIPLADWGPFIRYHSRWQPHGTNVTLMQRTGQQELHVRTYERGVEGETLACGTGAVAAALAAAYTLQMAGPLQVITSSKEQLTVDFMFSPTPPHFSAVTLTGAAVCTFLGKAEF
jgi:diaminopimelate epimerase